MALAETAALAVKLKLDASGFSSGIAKSKSELAGLNASVNKTGGVLGSVAGHIGGFQKNIGRAFSDLGRGVSTAASNIEKMGFIAGGLAIGGGIAAVKWAGDFEAQLNTINTIAFATPEALTKIGDSVRKIAKDTGVPLNDLTAAYYDLLSAGVKTSDAQSVLDNAVTLGIGGLATTAQTVDLLTTAYNAYGLTAEQTAQATDMFAQAIADGKVKADQISETFANVASIAKASGVGIDQIAASYGYLTAQGVPAAEVTTEMNRAIISLLKPSAELDAAGKKLKVNFTEDLRKKGLVPTLQEIRKYSDETGIPMIKLLGRVEAVKYALQTTGPQEAGFLAELDKIHHSSGEAAKQAAERQKGLNYELGRLKAIAKDAGITIGSALLPKLTPLVEELDTFLTGHQADIAQFGTSLADAFQGAVDWFKKLDFAQIGDDLRMAGSFARGLIEAFLGAPAWLQEAVVTGWGLNKLTGGAVQNIMADLTKAAVGGFLQQFVARGATPANPLFVLDVSGGLGKGLPGVGGGGSVLPALGVAGLIVAASVPIGEWFKSVLPDALKGPGGQGMSDSQRLTLAARDAVASRASSVAAGADYRLRDDFRGGMDQTIRGLQTLGDDFRGSSIEDAVARGVERGIVHSGVFKKAQAIREAGGFRLSRDELIGELHSGKSLGSNALITAEAIALASGNAVRHTPTEANLKSAAANLALLRRAQAHLPADLAAKLAPKIHSLQVAIDAGAKTVALAIKNKTFTVNAQTGFITTPGNPYGPRVPRPVPKDSRATEDRGATITVVSSVRDQNTARDVKSRYAPTPTQTGAQ